MTRINIYLKGGQIIQIRANECSRKVDGAGRTIGLNWTAPDREYYLDWGEVAAFEAWDD